MRSAWSCLSGVDVCEEPATQHVFAVTPGGVRQGGGLRERTHPATHPLHVRQVEKALLDLVHVP